MTPDEAKALTDTIHVLAQAVESKSSDLLPLYTALAGAAAGAIASFFPTFVLERYREKSISRRTLSSIITEISALLNIAELRNYHSSLKDIISHLEAQPPGTKHVFIVDVPPHYSRVYQQNCSKIGLIDEVFAKDIVVFHQLIDAVVQDVKPGGLANHGLTVEAYKEMERILSQALELGSKLVESHNKRLKRAASRYRASVP